MIKPCDIRDFLSIELISSKHFGTDTSLWVRERLYSQVHRLFLFNEEVVVSYELIGKHKYAIHILGETNKTKGFKDFVINSGSWMMKHTNCTCILAFAGENNKRLQRFIGLTGGKRVGYIPNADGELGEILYMYSKIDKEELVGRVSCLKP